MRRWLLLLVFWWGAFPLRAADFEAANQLYDEGKFAEAKAGYEKLVEAGGRSANLFYNLGNAHQRLGEPGKAVLGYERALTLDPSHPEARANLSFVRGQTGAVPWPASSADRLFPGRSMDGYAILGTIAGWVAILALASILLMHRRVRPALWFMASLALVVAGYSGAAVWHFEQDRGLAIVTAPTAQAHVAPAESSAPAGALPAGSEVRVLSERGDWTYCALSEQSRGWIPSKALCRMRLGKS